MSSKRRSPSTVDQRTCSIWGMSCMSVRPRPRSQRLYPGSTASPGSSGWEYTISAQFMLPALQPITTPSKPFRISLRPISWMKRFWVGTCPPQRITQSDSLTRRAVSGAFWRSSITMLSVSIPERWMQRLMPFSTESVKPLSSGAALTSSTLGFRPGPVTRAREAFTSERNPLSGVK